MRLIKGSPDMALWRREVPSRHFTPACSHVVNLNVAPEISPYEHGDLTHAEELLGKRFWEDDCVIYDRGYHSP